MLLLLLLDHMDMVVHILVVEGAAHNLLAVARNNWLKKKKKVQKLRDLASSYFLFSYDRIHYTSSLYAAAVICGDRFEQKSIEGGKNVF